MVITKCTGIPDVDPTALKTDPSALVTTAHNFYILSFLNFCGCQGIKTRFNINLPHKFKTKTYTHPTFCNHCGSLLWGFIRQGQHCTLCGINAHKRCTAHMPPTCGMDTKKIAKELEMMHVTAAQLQSPTSQVLLKLQLYDFIKDLAFHLY